MNENIELQKWQRRLDFALRCLAVILAIDVVVFVTKFVFKLWK
jgi:hypothetical protein